MPHEQLRVGSLFTGYGGLDLAVEQFFCACTVWTCDNDPGACKIIAHRYPDIPNLGDITKVDWTAVESIDILTGGWPCQPFSHAGKRLGAADDRALWPEVARAVRTLRPRYVVLENVAAIASAGELARATGDLAALGYVGSWRSLRAADVGAPHGRLRTFILAADTDVAGLERRFTERQRGNERAARPDSLEPVADATSNGWDGQQPERMMGYLSHGDSAKTGPDQVLPGMRKADDPQAIRGESDARGHGPILSSPELLPELWEYQDSRDQGHASLASAETSSDGVQQVRVDQRPTCSPQGQGPCEQRPGESSNALLFLPPEASLAGRPSQTGSRSCYLPQTSTTVRGVRTTPPSSMGEASDVLTRMQGGSAQQANGSSLCGCEAWGGYAPVVHRWELILQRAAPEPTELSSKGSRRLSPRAVEWMQGLPAGWVTDVPGLIRNAQLKALGNGCVPQQVGLALRLMTEDVR